MKTKVSIVILAAFFACMLFISNQSHACTRVVYQGLNGMVITARSMDWEEDIPTNLWIFPRGIERNGEVGTTSVKWKSKYGSVTTSSWDITSSDGMNEKGLVGNLLWLGESTFPNFEKDKDKAGLAVSLWLQFVLDNFATVAEAVKFLRKEAFVVVSSFLPGTDIYTAVHLSISDATGDNAIFEYINEKLEIHHDKSYVVMTNSPTFEDQLTINAYWKAIPGNISLPGTNSAPDRFVRASYYMNAMPKTDDTNVALAYVFGVIRNCSVPLSISSETEPKTSSTRWRTIADQKNLVYYFDNVIHPNVFWVEFNKIDFSSKGKVRKLSLENDENYSGESSKYFKVATPFKFAGLE